ncbi:MAG: hypothetical protein Q8R04_00890 [Nanoarchaeota archaeon]|nr:hypothetical protein [Nanoarchaeota archaeon]
METVLDSPAISKTKQNNQFSGLDAEFVVEEQTVVQCASSNGHKPFYLLCLVGKINQNASKGLPQLNVKITESKDNGPLYVNKGKDSFFIYNNGAVRRMMDALSINLTSELVGKILKVYNNEKGFWVIYINTLGN